MQFVIDSLPTKNIKFFHIHVDGIGGVLPIDGTCV